MTNVDGILKSRDITLPTKFHLVKAMVFPVVMYECESWTVKKVGRWRKLSAKNWCFWTVVLKRLLRVPGTARRSNKSILREISPGCSLEGLMLKLKLQYFGHLMQRVDSLKKTPMLGGIGGRRRRGWQRRRWLDGITDWMDMGWVVSGSWWWTGRPAILPFMGSQRVGHDCAPELKWTCMKCFLSISNFLEEISSLSHSIVFLYFLALTTGESFLISPCYSWNSALKLVKLSFSPMPLVSLPFSPLFKTSLENCFAFLRFPLLRMVFVTASCTMSQISVHHSSGTLSDLMPWIYLSLTV